MGNLNNRIVKERPNFGFWQVRSPSVIKKGMALIMVDVEQRTIRVVKEPQLRNRSLVLEVEHLDGPHKGKQETICLADYGVVPYQTTGGPRWHPTNRLLRIGPSPRQVLWTSTVITLGVAFLLTGFRSDPPAALLIGTGVALGVIGLVKLITSYRPMW